VKIDLAHDVLHNTSITVLIFSRFLVGFCNTLLFVKIYVINLKVFSRYLEKGNATSYHPFGHEQYSSNNINQNESAHGVAQSTSM
jgi:hypothetical protein